APAKRVDDRRMHRVKREPRVGQPFGELRNGAGIVIVEMRARGEHLDRLEAMAGDIDEVLAAQPRLVKEVGRDAEAMISQPLIIAIPPDVQRAIPAAARSADSARDSRARN